MTLNEPNGKKISGKTQAIYMQLIGIFISKYFILVYAYQYLIYKMNYWYLNCVIAGDKRSLKMGIHLWDHLNGSNSC